jgi:hypothetical protein
VSGLVTVTTPYGAASISFTVVEAAVPAECSPVLDGVIGADWLGPAIAVNTKPSPWGPDYRLEALRVCQDAAGLYLGITGTVAADNAIVLYVDRDYGEGTGTLPTEVRDVTGWLDQAFSRWPFEVTLPGFGAEFGWASIAMASKDGGVASDEIGVRGLIPPDNLIWYAADVTRCLAGSSCEVLIPWSIIYPEGRPANARLALFVAIAAYGGEAALSTKLPEQDTTEQWTVDTVVELRIP